MKAALWPRMASNEYSERYLQTAGRRLALMGGAVLVVTLLVLPGAQFYSAPVHAVLQVLGALSLGVLNVQLWLCEELRWLGLLAASLTLLVAVQLRGTALLQGLAMQAYHHPGTVSEGDLRSAVTVFKGMRRALGLWVGAAVLAPLLMAVLAGPARFMVNVMPDWSISGGVLLAIVGGLYLAASPLIAALLPLGPALLDRLLPHETVAIDLLDVSVWKTDGGWGLADRAAILLYYIAAETGQVARLRELVHPTTSAGAGSVSE